MGPPAASRKRNTITPKKSVSQPSNSFKKPTRPNGNIRNFFQKAEKEDEALFVGQGSRKDIISRVKPDDEAEPELFTDDSLQGDDMRFNEDGSAIKKRKLSNSDKGDDKENVEELFGGGGPDGGRKEPNAGETEEKPTKKAPAKKKGPFLDDSDSESDGEDDSSKPKFPFASVLGKVSVAIAEKSDDAQGEKKLMNPEKEKETSCPPPPPESEESLDNGLTGADDFDDFHDDDDIGGEEYRMMRFMEEQGRLEAEVDISGESLVDAAGGSPSTTNAMVTNCPICDGSLAGITSNEATRHVNACLDGNPIPLPDPEGRPPSEETKQLKTPKTVDGPELGKRFARAAVPRAGQANPFEIKGGGYHKPDSAFAQLMSGHAESAAWASAAATEQASRGKPAYERRCPFYKIMPNFYICVDAFRYGAVKECNAYFLSHFHSDHYIGLTAKWTHGPIYCSKVTGDLVKMQLRVDAKWVVSLEFEETVEVPGTEGVTVTMIPANHCPGSSLFLFEKTLGKGPNTRKQRILHCGDFRACPAQVAHPLLKPDVRDAISGKIKQQKIDICYLDTTYLNPRFSFPPQEDVVRSCAELCASLSPDPNSPDDMWDKMTRKNGTSSVSKYFTSNKQNPQPPLPPQDDGDNEASTTSSASAAATFFANVRDKKPPTPRQRLLVICGTYSIGKERICKTIAQALGTKIFASPAKIRICSTLGDPELAALMTSDPLEAQVHMQMLMEIRAETLRDYLDSYRPHFSRIVGFRPSGWNYRPPSSSSGKGNSDSSSADFGAAISVTANTSPASVPTTSVLHSRAWRSRFAMGDLVPQRGSMREAMCFGVPYSEHSSFRELAMFVMALRIERVIPTVNVGSEVSRKRMKGWVDRWLTERRRGGIVRVLVEGEGERAGGDGADGAAGGGGGGRTTVAAEANSGREVALWGREEGCGGGAWW